MRNPGRLPTATYDHASIPDEIAAIADFAAVMSLVGGGAEVICTTAADRI